MCPTGWFIPTADGPGYMQETLGEVHVMGELKVDGRIRTTEELQVESARPPAEIEAQLAHGGVGESSSERSEHATRLSPIHVTERRAKPVRP